ncbi:hypothetical protein A2833_01770 [Candidatus Azambacteria bacterium RIFCSPHIGHO2_01_FULL_44_55]|uniref:Uncharacterized protein n=1 Tax=Candidatus Azambacteria bacterium RIFCSPLOWO2_02_FULL_44_14 TaxID=1797306 RepID=A0A1F5CB04_9BACT|nr:MAG: hypothetical protein A3A18_01480 [Candidatus Azambacteria bacterium RIFCSPLOWO2_01_FULL_44_84]OGD33013.1 MAG: hypothetical protein A3C78_01375 [Candidatus Azambacteria bacterium RIFCSPHIGHO2_02_FULL_45_18]OGD39817.1 MAG: hypothetical protein A2833_01770 [Candidatus Azambacteria bacterium RIFCSPHIGHO2_01_FULL_44_55]OGD40059.1 MAG: hypothetical protein A3I30_02430 [Candidatus Azambacteria bacterium RIFCSPLOWO2_02_FULL_44_14]OGD51519.1 MAG: hypothetical protein A2608_00625 [Candidatus Azam
MIDFSKLTEQKISQKFGALPQGLKDVLSSTRTSSVVENIGKLNRLNDDQVLILQQLVGLVILGFVDFDEMKQEMLDAISITKSLVSPIAEEIRHKIFLPIINPLQQSQGIERASNIYFEIINENTIGGLSINKIKNAGLAPDEKREKLKSIIQNKYNHLPPDQKQLILQTISMRDKNEKNQAISALPKDTQWMINAKEVTTAPIWEF